MMRLAMIAMAAGLACWLAAIPAKSAEWPWCAGYGGEGGASNCGFASWQQCSAALGAFATRTLIIALRRHGGAAATEPAVESGRTWRAP